MNVSIITLALFCLSLPSGAQTARTDAPTFNRKIPEHVRLAFNRLAAGEPCSEADDLELIKAPGISTELVELLKAAYHGNLDYELMHSVMCVLRCRSDLTAEQQQWLRKELRSIWNQTDTPKTVMMKEDGIKLLSHYPNVENEDVMLLYLKESAHGGVIGCSRMAVFGLESIGTARSLPGLNAYLEQLPSMNELETTRRDEVKKLIHFIASKLSASPKATAPSVPP